MTPHLLLIDPGLALSLQDFGRVGLQRFGVPPAGALDRDAMRLANALVGAPAEQPALEARFLGPTFEVAAESVRMAIVGAEVAAQLTPAAGGEPYEIGADRTYRLRRGDRLKVGPLRGSSTAYIAVEGGFDVSPTLGSASFLARGPFGGFFGRKLAAGDKAALRRAEVSEDVERALPAPYMLAPPDRIRVVLGPQEDYLTASALETLLTAEWRVSADIDRMGLRLDGPQLEHSKGFNIVSDGSVTGAIQAPGAGQPIILMPDRGTAGGYPKAATVISADLGALGRLSPGAIIRFEAISAARGVALTRARHAEIEALIASIGPAQLGGAINTERLYEGNLITGLVEEAIE
ncbi:MAG: biotin-dependent carboxyltransferase family protein [Neomegalonema sp.]|nr:biotin-dependent carboxyltransferase family protein [Neomegalonema sp.]